MTKKHVFTFWVQTALRSKTRKETIRQGRIKGDWSVQSGLAFEKIPRYHQNEQTKDFET